MLRLAAVLAVAFAFAGSASGLTSIKGSYTTTLSGLKPTVLNGVWRITLTGGVEKITHLNQTVVTGHYSVSGNRVTFSRESGPFSCGPRAGVYRWSLRAKVLTLVAVNDTCTGRKLVLTAHPLRKVA